jgi:hypothetical protein
MSLARSLPLLACAALVVAGGPAHAQERVGVTSAVNPAAAGTPPGLPTRTLVLGTDVVFNERITTEATGQTELLFLDRSSFSIGPSSEITIDQFVYDPAAGTGKLAASAAKGVFRFVGGALSKNPDGVTIRTPTATIGLRGGICVLSVAPNGTTSATFVYGREMQVTANGVTTRATRPNSIITVAGPGAAPTPPTLAPPGAMGTLLAQLDGQPGATGGTPTPPSSQQLAQSGYSQTNSQNLQGSTTDSQRSTQASSGPPPAPPPINVANFTNLNVTQTVQSNASAQATTPPSETFDLSGLDAGLTEAFLELNSLFGNLTPTSAMPTVGTASYSGSATGVVVTDSASVSATGTFVQSWDFSRRSGSLEISNFAGATISGSATSVPTLPTLFYGGVNGIAADRAVSGAVFGVFQTVNGTPAGQTSGTFSFSGSGVAGGGQFRGTKGPPTS